MQYNELNTEVRNGMVAELKHDIDNNCVSESKRFSLAGKDAWFPMLTKALSDHTDDWLKDQLINNQVFRSHQDDGKKINVEAAATTLSQCEFNRFYMRGVCRYAIDNSWNIRIIRVQTGKILRPESERLIGQIVDPKIILEDLRKNIAEDTDYGLGKPNSGLSITIIREAVAA